MAHLLLHTLDQNTESGIRGVVPAVVLWICGWKRRLSRPDPQCFDARRNGGLVRGMFTLLQPLLERLEELKVRVGR